VFEETNGLITFNFTRTVKIVKIWWVLDNGKKSEANKIYTKASFTGQFKHFKFSIFL